MESLKKNFEEKRDDIIHSFLLLFGKEGRLSSMWNESRGRILRALSPPGTPQREESNGNSSSSNNDEIDYSPPTKTRKIN